MDLGNIFDISNIPLYNYDVAPNTKIEQIFVTAKRRSGNFDGEPAPWKPSSLSQFTGYFEGEPGLGNGGEDLVIDAILTVAAPEEKLAEAGYKAFRSFGEFKRYFGSAGWFKDWHHIVEQTPKNIEQFGAEAIHNTDNVISISRSTHWKISGFYSSKFGESGQTVREWLRDQSFEDQYEFGVEVLRRHGINVE